MDKLTDVELIERLDALAEISNEIASKLDPITQKFRQKWIEKHMQQKLEYKTDEDWCLKG